MRSYIIESSFPHIVVLMYWYHRFGHVQKLSTVVGLTPVQGEREPQVAMHQVDAQVSISSHCQGLANSAWAFAALLWSGGPLW